MRIFTNLPGRPGSLSMRRLYAAVLASGLTGAAGVASAQPTGACCLPRGGCLMYTRDICVALGGTYAGDGITCAQRNCPGACCTVDDGVCRVESYLTCHRKGWNWKGGSCADNPCPAHQSAVNVPLNIPDAPGPGAPGQPAVVMFTVPDQQPISDVHIVVYIAHPRQGDLRMVLTHVATGRSVTLVDRPGALPTGAGGFTAVNYGATYVTDGENLLFGDDGDTPYSLPAVPSPGIPNVTGTYKALAPLSAFAGETAQGLWQLSVTDWSPGAAGTVVRAVLALDLQRQPCYANCDSSTSAPVLNVNDFNCFLNRFASGDPYANCDGSTLPPVLNVNDFQCFLNRFATGCP